MGEFNRLEAERKEAELLVEKGFTFEVGKRELYIKPLCFGTIIHANRYAVDMKINILEEDSVSLYKEIDRNTEPLMRFIAVCVLHKKWKIKLFTRLLAKYLKWRLKPKDALGISLAILQMYDMANFITSIRMLGQMTITSPKETNPIDGNSEVSTVSTEQ